MNSFKHVLLFGAAALFICAAVGRAGGGKGDYYPVPRAVRDTLNNVTGGAPIDSIEREGDGDAAVYIADAKIDGEEYEIRVAASGKLISKKMEDVSGGQGNQGNTPN